MRAPLTDNRVHEVLHLPNGMKVAVVADSSATRCAACCITATGYFDDPDDLPGLAHFLEHAVHLGSTVAPGAGEFKRYLAQHAGSSNASTGMTHTRFHWEADAAALEGGLKLTAAFFADAALDRNACEREVLNVDAEYAQKRNSDARKLLQLRRSSGSKPYSMFSTGNLATLWTGPAERGRDVVAALRHLWATRYVGQFTTAAVLSPYSVAHMKEVLHDAFGTIPAAPRTCHPFANSDARRQGHQEEAGSLCAEADAQTAGWWYEIAPRRELRTLDIAWTLPFSQLQFSASKPVAFVSHILGNENRGCLAHLLKVQGLIQQLSTSVGDHCTRSPTFTMFHCEMELTSKGLRRIPFIMGAVFAYCRLLVNSVDSELEGLWADWKSCRDVLFDYQEAKNDRAYVQDLALRLHHHPPADILASSVPTAYSKPALEAVLGALAPQHMNVYLASNELFLGKTEMVEPWYGARYNRRRLPDDVAAAVDAARAGQFTLAGLQLPGPCWARPELTSHPPQLDAPAIEQTPSLPPLEDPTTEPRLDLSSRGEPPTPSLLRVGGARVWLCRDTRFGAPRMRVSCLLVTECVYASARSYALSQLLARVIDAVAEPDVYDALTMRGGASVEAHVDGLLLHVWGFSHTVPLIVRRLRTAFQSLGDELSARPALFPACRASLLQRLANQRCQSPVQHALLACRAALQSPFWHPAEQLASLGGAQPPDDGTQGAAGDEEGVLDLFARIRESARVEMLLTGDVCESDARAIATSLVQLVKGDLCAAPVAEPTVSDRVDHTPTLLGGASDASTEEEHTVTPSAATGAQRSVKSPGNAAANEQECQSADQDTLRQSPAADGSRERHPCSPPRTLPCAVDTSLKDRIPRRAHDLRTLDCSSDRLRRLGIKIGPLAALQASLRSTDDASATCCRAQAQEDVGKAGGDAGRAREAAVVHASVRNPNAENANNGVVLLWRAGGNDVDTRAMVKLFVQVSSKACFHQLRTVESLGYSVRLSHVQLPDAPCVAICIQSRHCTTHLYERAQAWMAAFACDLAQLGPADFESHKRALAQSLTKPHTNLSQAHASKWKYVLTADYSSFQRPAATAAAAMLISLEQLREWHRERLLGEGGCFVAHLCGGRRNHSA